MSTPAHLDEGALSAFVGRQAGGPVRELEMDIRPLRGGLESAAVARVGARFLDQRGKARLLSFVVKRLEGEPAREAEIYETLLGSLAPGFSPGLLGIDRMAADRCLLFLEPIRPVRRWPWRETELAGLVLDQLAQLHAEASFEGKALPLPSWDYDAELQRSARETLAFLAELPRDEDLLPLRRALAALRRMVFALPDFRRHLLDFPLLGRSVIHGDVHPGNALVRVRDTQERPVLLDWGRARIGSPLEDVSSWLQSLGYWEPQARRRHDTLLVRYLRARGLPPRLDRDLRDAYWLAGASNALSGALAYHLWRGMRASGPNERASSLHSAGDCLRVIRRADMCWRRIRKRNEPLRKAASPPPD
ncbi:MAG TPA: phosphotransferase [Thermoanaerobaculia bacterium]|nr:phosphotransferase [Thermoanaerobaculia bacterium]